MALLTDSPLPLTRAYVESLPDGLASYSEVMIKGSACSAVLQNLPPGFDLQLFPDELRDMVENPPPVSMWIPEIPFVALMTCVGELLFDDSDAFLEWTEEGFQKYFSASLYRILFAVLSPQRLAKGADKKWGALRKGSRREMIEATDTFNRGRVIYPRNAFSPLYVKLLCRGFLTAYRLSRAKNASVRLATWAPTESVIEIVYDIDNFTPLPGASRAPSEDDQP